MTQISQLFKFSLLIVLFLSNPVSSKEHEVQYFFEIEQRIMQDDWSFLPEIPPSFQSSKTNSFELGFMTNDYGVMIGQSKLELDLLRSSEPKDVSLSANKVHLDLFYRFNDARYLKFSFQQQEADEQRFDCYTFSTIILGNCTDSDIQLSSTQSKYDRLHGSLIALDADTKTLGLNITQELDSFWLDAFSFGLASTKHEYDWLTPIEDIQSPFILDLMINGNRLGDMIESTLNQLPQQESWKLHQINVQAINSFPLGLHYEFFYALDLVFLDFKNYHPIRKSPRSNAKLNMGIRWQNEALSIDFFGNLYSHNLIGFEPITFNQRTEHYFDKNYGELGVKFKLSF